MRTAQVGGGGRVGPDTAHLVDQPPKEKQLHIEGSPLHLFAHLDLLDQIDDVVACVVVHVHLLSKYVCFGGSWGSAAFRYQRFGQTGVVTEVGALHGQRVFGIEAFTIALQWLSVEVDMGCAATGAHKNVGGIDGTSSAGPVCGRSISTATSCSGFHRRGRHRSTVRLSRPFRDTDRFHDRARSRRCAARRRNGVTSWSGTVVASRWRGRGCPRAQVPFSAQGGSRSRRVDAIRVRRSRVPRRRLHRGIRNRGRPANSASRDRG